MKINENESRNEIWILINENKEKVGVINFLFYQVSGNYKAHN